jgi:hypothetical protein
MRQPGIAAIPRERTNAHLPGFDRRDADVPAHRQEEHVEIGALERDSGANGLAADPQLARPPSAGRPPRRHDDFARFDALLAGGARELADGDVPRGLRRNEPRASAHEHSLASGGVEKPTVERRAGEPPRGRLDGDRGGGSGVREESDAGDPRSAGGRFCHRQLSPKLHPAVREKLAADFFERRQIALDEQNRSASPRRGDREGAARGASACDEDVAAAGMRRGEHVSSSLPPRSAPVL